MYNTIKNLIPAGGYKLAEMQTKLKKLYLLGDLTEEQLDELLALAAAGISTDAERPEALLAVARLAERVEALEAKVAALEGTEGGADASTYEDWAPWDGVSNKYQPDAIVRHGGKLWRSTHQGQNVWEPGAPGTEALWAVYEEAGQ